MTDPGVRVTSDAPGSLQDVLPPSRAVRWLVLALVILLSVGMYFRWGVDLAPVGATPQGAVETTPLTPTR